MKILHLCTFFSGGAGQAAYRLHKALLENGMNSKMLFVQSLPVNKNLAECYSLFPLSLSQRIQLKIKKLLSLHSLQIQYKKIAPAIHAETVLMPFSGFHILNHSLVKDADILHLHWVGGMIDYPSFFKNCDKNIVWTLHDMNPFSGMFVYHGDELLNHGVANKLDKNVLALKKDNYKKIKSRLFITTPSRWLYSEMLESKIFENVKATVIPYTIDLEIFKPMDKSACLEELGINENETVLLFIAASVQNKRKGFDLLQLALKNIIHDNAQVRLIAIGNKNENDCNDLPVTFTGRIDNETLLAKYYSASDALILPSLEDNLPNVMVEAFACGLPVIGFAVGGIREHVQNGVTGFLAAEMNEQALTNSIENFLESQQQFTRSVIREYAVDHFNSNTISEKFKKVYLSFEQLN